MKKSILLFSCLTFVVVSHSKIALANEDPSLKPVWQSLGGDFTRSGLSENNGPELGCVKWKFETDGAVSTSVTIDSDD